MNAELDQALKEFDLSLVSELTETSIARLWRVRLQDGSDAVLKLYRRPDRGNERAGTALLRAWHGRGAVQIFAETKQAVVMEWLDGPSLSQIAYQDDPRHAVHLLAKTARGLHPPPTPIIASLTPLPEVLSPLFNVSFSPECSDSLKTGVIAAAGIARRLLGGSQTPTALHGDLHHSNVIVTAAGPRALDAKGFCGDIGYELANAFRHPGTLPDLLRDPDWISFCRDVYAQALDVTETRLAEWAAVKCALSIVWRSGGCLKDDPEADLLSCLLAGVG